MYKVLMFGILLNLSVAAAGVESGPAVCFIDSPSVQYRYSYSANQWTLKYEAGPQVRSVFSLESNPRAPLPTELSYVNLMLRSMDTLNMSNKKITKSVVFPIVTQSAEWMGLNPSVAIYELSGGERLVIHNFKRIGILSSTYCKK